MGFERKLGRRSRVLTALSGPRAVQLAKYIGSLHGGTLGATLTGAAFILPLFLMVLGLASLYVHFGKLAWV